MSQLLFVTRTAFALNAKVFAKCEGMTGISVVNFVVYQIGLILSLLLYGLSFRAVRKLVSKSVFSLLV